MRDRCIRGVRARLARARRVRGRRGAGPRPRRQPRHPEGGSDAGARADARPPHRRPERPTWSAAPAVDEFVEREPHEGGVPSERTEFRVAYDQTTLYVKVRAWDTQPDRIVGYLTRRDDDSPSDWIRVMIDSYHDRRTAYEFAVNPAGVKADPTGSATGTATRAGTRCGTSASRATSTAGRPNSASRFRSCASRRARRGLSASRSRARSAG